MSEDDKGGAEQRTTPEMRKASLLLSGLVLTPDSALDSFRKRRAADPNIDERHLKHARDLLDAVAEAITSTDASRWALLERAWSALQGQEPSGLPLAAAPSAAPRPSSEPVGGTAPGPLPPPPVGTPITAEQVPTHARATEGKSPWAGPTLQSGVPRPQPPRPAESASPPPPLPAAPPSMPVAPPSVPRGLPPVAPAPVAPAPVAAPVAPAPVAPAPDSVAEADNAPRARGSAPTFRFDVDALNQIKLDEDEVGTLPADRVFATSPTPSAPAVLPFHGRSEPPKSALSDADGDRDPLGMTTTDTHSPFAANVPAFMRPAPHPGAEPDYAPTERLSLAEEVRRIERERAGAASAPPAPGSQPSSAPPAASSAPGAPPSSRALPPHLQQLTLEQYAALCAECAVSPHWTAQVQARYGVVSGDERRALDHHWGTQLSRDANLSNTFRWHYARYEEWARSRSS